ncbi:MAG: MFS transporter [archaeon]|nr:MFS transporter [archaeon]
MKSEKKYSQLKPLWISVFVDILGFTIILPFLPLLAQEYTDNFFIIGLLISSNAIFGFIFGPILSRLSDRFGRRPLLLISQAGTLVGFLILAFSNSLELLFIARIVDGVFGGQFPISKAVIADVIPPKERPKYMTNIGNAFTLAAVLGPGIGGILADTYGIIGPGLLASTIACITIIFTATSLNETLPMKIDNPPEWIVESRKMMKSQEINNTNKNDNNNDSSIWKNERAVFFLTLYIFVALAATIFQTTFSLFCDLNLNLGSTQIGLLFSSMGLFQVFFRFFLFNRIRIRLGDIRTSLFGLGSYIIGYFLLGIVTDYWAMMFVLFFISTAGACSRGIITGFMSRVVSYRHQGKIMGYSSSLDSFSQIVGPTIGTMILYNIGSNVFGIVLSLLSIVPFFMGFRIFSFGFDKKD